MILEVDFLKHLLDLDSMEVIVREGVPEDVLPTEDIRLLYRYALEYYFNSGKTRTISESSLSSYEVSIGRSLLDLITDLEITLDDAELEITDCIMKLKGQFIQKEVAQFNKSLAMAMADAPIEDRLKVASDCALDLIGMVSKLESHRTKVTSSVGIEERWANYKILSESVDSMEGMSLGLKELDDHTLRLHTKELGVFAAGPKSGKSLMSVLVALENWKLGKHVGLFTLENSIDMTLDRLICMATNIDSTRFQKGECNEEEKNIIDKWREEIVSSDNPIYIFQPESGHRSVQYMMREAQSHDVDCVIIDQLSHIEHLSPGRKPRNEIVRDIMQELKIAASTGSYPLPVLVFAQINRDGMKAADKIGWHEMFHIAESSEVERSADLVLSLYQSRDARQVNRALLQILAARRVGIKNWDILWNTALGFSSILNERELVDS